MKKTSLKLVGALSFIALLGVPPVWAAQPETTPAIQYEFNQALHTELLAMREQDQALRTQAQTLLEQSGGQITEEIQAILQAQSQLDQQLMQRLKAIIEHYGWPGISLVGEEGAKSAFLILQHSETPKQKLYLETLKAAVAAHQASASHLAMLEDRILMKEGQKQIYGTQLYSSVRTDNKLVIYPIQDEMLMNAELQLAFNR